VCADRGIDLQPQRTVDCLDRRLRRPVHQLASRDLPDRSFPICFPVSFCGKQSSSKYLINKAKNID